MLLLQMQKRMLQQPALPQLRWLAPPGSDSYSHGNTVVMTKEKWCTWCVDAVITTGIWQCKVAYDKGDGSVRGFGFSPFLLLLSIFAPFSFLEGIGLVPSPWTVPESATPHYTKGGCLY
jgi:hypothetical protein